MVSFRWSNVLHALFKNAQLISRILEHNKNLISHVNTVGTYYKHCKKRIMHVIRTIRDLFLCINDPQINFTDGIYGLIHIVPCCQLVEQKSEQIEIRDQPSYLANSIFCKQLNEKYITKR